MRWLYDAAWSLSRSTSPCVCAEPVSVQKACLDGHGQAAYGVEGECDSDNAQIVTRAEASPVSYPHVKHTHKYTQSLCTFRIPPWYRIGSAGDAVQHRSQLTLHAPASV